MSMLAADVGIELKLIALLAWPLNINDVLQHVFPKVLYIKLR